MLVLIIGIAMVGLNFLYAILFLEVPWIWKLCKGIFLTLFRHLGRYQKKAAVAKNLDHDVVQINIKCLSQYIRFGTYNRKNKQSSHDNDSNSILVLVGMFVYLERIKYLPLKSILIHI